MGKTRQVKYFIDVPLQKNFRWIRSRRRIGNFIPSAMETWKIEFSMPLLDFASPYIVTLERRRLEQFVFDFYEVEKRRHQVIFCWRETEVIIIVFKTL